MTNSCQPYASFCVILTTSADLMGMEDERLKNNSSKHAGGLPYPLYIGPDECQRKTRHQQRRPKIAIRESKGDAVARAGMERAALRR